MDGYMTTKEAAKRWKISIRQVQNYCRKGRIPGLQRVGTNYLIPENASKPKDTFVCEMIDTKKDE